MLENHPVYFGKEVVGKVQAVRQGLYWRFDCRCQLQGSVVCRLVAQWEGGQENLGIPVPCEDGFQLQTRIAAKRMGDNPVFCLIPKVEKREQFVPIIPEEPFHYLSRLKKSYLVRRGDQVGILIDNQPVEEA